MSEYWIHNDGYVDFADGDVGDRNHEAVVIDQVMRTIVNKCENEFNVKKKSWHGTQSFSDGEYIDWDEFTNELATTYASEYIQKNPRSKKWIEETLENDPDKLVLAAAKQAGVTKIEWEGISGQTDARDYAMKYWGWKVYRDYNIVTWLFRSADLQAIVQGIEEISEQEGWSDKKLERSSFSINVISTGKDFNLTYQQLKNPRQRLSAQSSNPQINNLINFGKNNATKQVKDIDLKNIHPAYTGQHPNRTAGGVNPFGDSVIYPFRTFLNENDLDF